MYFVFGERIREIAESEISSDRLTAGYVSGDELSRIAPVFGFSDSTVRSCGKANGYFRSGVEIYDKYTFTELRIIDINRQKDDCVAIYIMKNLFIVVDVEDEDGSTQAKFAKALSRYTPDTVTLEKLLYAFFDALVSDDLQSTERLGIELSQLEEGLLQNGTVGDLNPILLRNKRLLLRLRNYYEQILDITESIDENENELFPAGSLMYINNLTKRVQRLKEDTDSLKNTVEHLQDAYNAYLDAKLNNTMKIFTVLTSVFFPLTIIVGWYGMNFQSMPEFSWKYGYVYVILLSAAVVTVLWFTGKRRKWF